MKKVTTPTETTPYIWCQEWEGVAVAKCRVTWQSDLNKGTTIKFDVPAQRGENHD